MAFAEKHILFGIDGGGTGCRVAACDASGERIGEVKGGPANVTSDRQSAISNVRVAVDAFLQKFAIADDVMKASIGHVGLAGVLVEADAIEVAAALPFAGVVVSDDRKTSLIGALGDRFGALAAIGTGTIIAAHSPKRTRYFGGWGLQLSDQASGAWLGCNALRRTVLAHDGLYEHSHLTEAILEDYDNDLSAMVAFAKLATPGDYASTARRVVDAARAGDSNARDLMQDGARYLEACLDAGDLAEGDILCLSGGIGPHYQPYLSETHQARIQPPNGTPLDGALILAKQKLDQLRAAS